MAQWSPHTSMASTPLPNTSPLESNRTWRKTRFRPNGHPRAPKSKSQSFDTDQGCAIRARSSVLSRTDVTFWKTKLQLKKKKKNWKKKIGNWKFCRPSNEIGSVQCDLKQNDKLLVWTDPIAPRTRPLAPPLNPPSLYRPPLWRQQSLKDAENSSFMTTSFKSTCKERQRNPIRANSGNEIDSATLNEQDYKISPFIERSNPFTQTTEKKRTLPFWTTWSSKP